MKKPSTIATSSQTCSVRSPVASSLTNCSAQVTLTIYCFRQLTSQTVVPTVYHKVSAGRLLGSHKSGEMISMRIRTVLHAVCTAALSQPKTRIFPDTSPI